MAIYIKKMGSAEQGLVKLGRFRALAKAALNCWGWSWRTQRGHYGPRGLEESARLTPGLSRSAGLTSLPS